MQIKLYLTEPEERIDGPASPPTGQAWFLSRGATPLSNEAFLAWKEFLTRSEITRFVYCQHCGAANEVKNNGHGVKDHLLPLGVLMLKQQCIKEGRADWFQLRASDAQTALFASKGKEMFLIAQWGQERIHTQDEVIEAARAKKRLKQYTDAEIRWSLIVCGCGMLVVALAMLVMISTEEINSYMPAGITLMALSVLVCIGIFERLKRKIRRQFAFIF